MDHLPNPKENFSNQPKSLSAENKVNALKCYKKALEIKEIPRIRTDLKQLKGGK